MTRHVDICTTCSAGSVPVNSGASIKMESCSGS